MKPHWYQRVIPTPWPLRSMGVVFFAGICFCLGLAPWDWWVISLVSVATLAIHLKNRTPLQSFWLGWSYGFGVWLTGVSWIWVSIYQFGDTSAILAALMVAIVAVIMGFLTAVQCWLYGILTMDRWPVLGFTALWVVFEWLRSWLLTGFPWLYLGYGFLDTPLAGYAPVGGVFLVSAMALLLVLHCIRLRWASLLWMLLILLGGHLLNGHAFTRPWGAPLAISIVQGNIPQDTKWEESRQDAILNIYRQMSVSEWGRDLVLWPEAAITRFYDEAIDDLENLDAVAAKHHSALITGIPYATPPPYRYYNSVLALGTGRGFYEKQQLVPFGEYIPFEAQLRGLMPFFDLPMSSFSWGSSRQQPMLVQEIRVQPSICYEVAYPQLMQSEASKADLMITISNDAWFGRSHGPWQHFEMVRMRALESGRYFLSGTNNGITAVVNPRGKVVAMAPQFKAVVLRAQVYPMRGLTPWLVIGNRLVLIPCFSVLLLAGGRSLSRRYRRRIC